MGLDSVELVLDVEEAFDIQIPDDLAVQIRTVGDLYDLIIKLNSGSELSSEKCLSAATFRLIRDAVCSDLSIDVDQFRPRDSVDAMLPRKGRRQLWLRLEESLDLKWPSLVRPSWLTMLATVTTVLCSAFVGHFVYQNAGGNVAIFSAITTAIVAGFVLMAITEPFATHASNSFATFRGLTKVILAFNYSRLCNRLNAVRSPTDIWDVLRIIIVKQLGVKPEAVTRQANFINDLGMN